MNQAAPMFRRLAALFVTVVALNVAACASLDASRPAKVQDGILTDTAGMTLYSFDRDTAGSGRSVCNGPCAANWPAFAALPTAQPQRDWTIVARDDGGRQWAFRGKPLYTFAKDIKPGDRVGDGFLDNAWHVVRP
jgi:predicted lipoprotein with Yx(FWY)xxD motif